MRLAYLRRPAATILIVATFVALAVALLACGSDDTDGAEPPSRELTVSAGAALNAAFTEMGTAFDDANGTRTSFNFDAAGTLQQQIEAGAPVDVFASGAPKQMDALLEKGLVDEGSHAVFAVNQVVLVVPAGSTLSLPSFEGLAHEDVRRIVYGDPAITAVGVAAEEILTRLGVLDQVRPKVIYARNVAQALEYVGRGEVDAAITFATEVQIAPDTVRMVATADAAWHTPIEYPIAVVKSSDDKTLAQAFIDFVTGPQGQAILQKHGFTTSAAR
jgi:molybdate transport system substrate-binding protein